MKITGRYEQDQNFTTIYGNDNRLYVIARKTGEWGSLGVGDTGANGLVLTQELFDKWAAECKEEVGTFELP